MFLHIYHFQNQKQTRKKWKKRDTFMTSIIQVIIMDSSVTCEYKNGDDDDDDDNATDNDKWNLPCTCTLLGLVEKGPK